jgi:multiple sugar transport system substrate-binding protein
VVLAPFVAAEGHEPGCGTGVGAFVIPKGAQNVEAAHDYINWIMGPEQNADWVIGPGGGFPTLGATQAEEHFQTPFYRQASQVVAASNCRPWYGTLQRRDEAKSLVMNTIYKLIKEDPTADIAAALAATEQEYNAGN